MGTGSTVEEKKRTTGLWTLASDGIVAVRFPSEEWVMNQITSGASISVDKVITAVGLVNEGEHKGELPSNWNTGTDFISASTTVINALTDLDSAITTVSGDIESTIIKLSGDVKTYVDTVSGNIETTILALSGDTKEYVDTVSGNIESTIITLSGDVKNYVDTLSGNVHSTFDALDKEASAKVGQVVTTVSQANGLVSETQAYLKDITLSGYSKDTTKTGAIADTDTVNDALSKLENQIGSNSVSNADGSITVTTGSTTDVAVHIKTGEGVLKLDGEGGGLYTALDLVKITTGLPETVKERYQLLDSDDNKIGVDIDVPKDSHIVSINYITSGAHAQNLEYVYIDASGNTQTTYVDMSELVIEAEFKSGVTATDGIVHGVVDSTSEKDSQETPVDFLTVGADGFKVSGIKDEITRKIAALDVTGDTAVAGQYVAAIEETDGVVAVKTRANVSEAVLNNYSKGADDAPVAATDTVNQAISKLENQIDAAKSAATTKVEKDAAAAHLTIASAMSESDSSVTYTIGENDIASASALTAEETRAKAAEAALDGVVGSVKAQDAETRTYSHTGTNYLDSNSTVKADAETLDSLLGVHTGETETDYNVTFSSSNTVAKSISDIKKELDEYKDQLTLAAVDDDKYIATQVTTAATGTTIGVSAITMDITASTTASTALADAHDVKLFAVSEVKDNSSNGGLTKIQVVVEDDVKKLDVSNLTVDCGEF